MTTEEKIKISQYCMFTMKPEERNAYIDSGVFNEIIEAYMKEYLSRLGINKTMNEVHEDFKSIYDIYNAEDILDKARN